MLTDRLSTVPVRPIRIICLQVTFNMANFPQDIEIEVVFALPEYGGRLGPIYSGLRPELHYDGKTWQGSIHFQPDHELPKGVPVKLVYAFLCPQYPLADLFPGKEILLRHGAQVIACGRVVRLLGLESQLARRAKQYTRFNGRGGTQTRL
jgi:hypothetical protein